MLIPILIPLVFALIAAADAAGSFQLGHMVHGAISTCVCAEMLIVFAICLRIAYEEAKEREDPK